MALRQSRLFMKHLFNIAVILALLLFTHCQNDLREVESASRLYEPTRETGQTIELNYTENGNTKVRLRAPSLIRSKTKDPYVEFPDGLKVWFYNDSLEETSTLQAEYGIRYEKENKTYFRDSVHLKNVADEQLFTEELIWDEKEETIYSEKFVRIVTPDQRITGKGFKADQQFTNYTIQNISGKVYVQPDKTDEDL